MMYEVAQVTLTQKRGIFWHCSRICCTVADTQAVILVLLLHIYVVVLKGIQRNQKVIENVL